MNTLAKPATLLGQRMANRIRARVSYLEEPEYDAVAALPVEVVTRFGNALRGRYSGRLPDGGRPDTRARLDVPLNEEQLPAS